MEVKIAPFIHGMENLRQNISLSGNPFVDVPPVRENESHKMLTIFYRTASDSTVNSTATVAAITQSRPASFDISSINR